MLVPLLVLGATTCARASGSPAGGPFVLQLRDVGAPQAIGMLAELVDQDVLVSSDLATTRVQLAVTASGWPELIDRVVNAAGGESRLLPSGIRVVASRCRFAVPAPALAALPPVAHRTISFGFPQVGALEGLAMMAANLEMAHQAQGIGRPVGVRARSVQTSDLLAALALAETLDPVQGGGPLDLAPRLDVGCPAVAQARPQPQGPESKTPLLRRFDVEQLRMVGYFRRRGQAPLAVVALPDGNLRKVRLGDAIGHSGATVTGVFGDGVFLDGDMDRPALPFVPLDRAAAPTRKEIAAGAEGGNAADAALLALMYQVGNGVRKDSSLELEWRRRAARSGDSEAAVELAAGYLNADRRDRLPADVVGWLERTAQAADAEAAGTLGLLLRKDGGALHKDDAEARRWLTVAAQNDRAGWAYLLSVLMDEDSPESQDWLTLAAESGVPPAQEDLGKRLAGTIGERPSGHHVRDAAWAQAVHWLERAWANERPVATQLGILQLHPSNGEASKREAKWWFETGAARGDATAQGWAGALARDGIGQPFDAVAAARWFRRAASQGDALARVDLARLLIAGQAGPADPAAAIDWLRQAARAVPGRAETGPDAKAIELSPRGDPQAQRLLGELLVAPPPAGRSRDADRVEGARWLLVAAEQGDEDARREADGALAALTPALRERARRDARAWLAANPDRARRP